jgi:hypothetical protein
MPLAHVIDGPVSIHTVVRDKCFPSRRSSPPSIGFNSPSGVGKETKYIASNGIRLALLPPCQIFFCPRFISVYFSTHV